MFEVSFMSSTLFDILIGYHVLPLFIKEINQNNKNSSFTVDLFPSLLRSLYWMQRMFLCMISDWIKKCENKKEMNFWITKMMKFHFQAIFCLSNTQRNRLFHYLKNSLLQYCIKVIIFAFCMLNCLYYIDSAIHIVPWCYCFHFRL